MNKNNKFKFAFCVGMLTSFAFAGKLMSQINTFPWIENFGSSGCGLPSGFTNSGSDPWDFQNVNETYMLGLDHTSNGGCFANMDDSGTAVDDSSLLVTDTFDITSIPNGRLSFWWQNSNGTTSQPAPTGPRPWTNLYVDVSTDGGASWIRGAWAVEDSQQVGWTEGLLNLAPYVSTTLQLRFRGLETQSFYSDMSIDDLMIFNPPNDDASITQLYGLDVICAGSVPVTAKLKNVGGGALTSATINWTVNGVLQTPYNYAGNLASLADTLINIGSFTAASGVAYNVVAWSSAPNASVDGNTSNDTVSISGVMPGLAAGTYTVGPAGDFTSLVDLANTLSSHGVCGAITVNVTNGTYPGKLYFGPISGTSSVNTININGNGATISAAPTSADRYVVRLDGVQYLTLDSLVIVGTDATYGWGVHLMNNANNNTISNCTIDLTAVTSTSSLNSSGILASNSTSSMTTGGYTASNCTFSGNTIMGGASNGGLYYAIRLNGTTAGEGAADNTIINNTIVDGYIYNIYLNDTRGTLVSGNDISRAGKLTVSTFYGIYLTGDCRDVLIERNRIHNTHDAASSLTGAAYGVYFSSADAPAAQPNIVANNLLYNFNGDGTVYAFYNSGSDSTHFYYNTVSLDHTAATAGTTRGFYQTTTASGIVIQNNIFSITRGGSGEKHGLYFNTNTSDIFSDNNIIYLNSSGTGAQSTGRWDAVNYIDLAGWQTANNGVFDLMSDSLDPAFTSLVTNDFTPTSFTANNMAMPIAGITSDFFNNTRSSTPDPGAIEYAIVPMNDSCTQAVTIATGLISGTTVDATTDIAPACTVTDDPSGGVWYHYLAKGDFVSLALCNSSFDTRIRVFEGSCGNLTCVAGNDDSCGVQSVVGWCSANATDYYILVYGNGGVSGTFELSLSETALSDPTITAASNAFCAGDSLELQASVARSYEWNDVASTTTPLLVVKEAGVYWVEVIDTNGCAGISDPFTVTENPLPVVNLGADTTICDNASITLDAGPGNVFVWSTGQNTQTISYSGSNGSALVTVVVTDVNGCNGQDEIDITVDICSGIEENDNNIGVVYPNPTNGPLVVELNTTGQYLLEIRDIRGVVVYTTDFISVSGQQQELDLGFLQKGMYTLTMHNNISNFMKRIVLQ
jgi:parallel beta-helix repeat protein